VKLRAFLKSEHPIKEIEIGCGNGKFYKSAIYYATDEYLAERLRELGIVPHRKNFNQAIIHLPKRLENHWLRGYFDGDGAARKPNAKNVVSISICGSATLLKWIRAITANNVGTNPNLSVNKHRTAKIYYLSYSGNHVANNVAMWMYQDATIWLPRKKKTVDDWPQAKNRIIVRDEKGRFI